MFRSFLLTVFFLGCGALWAAPEAEPGTIENLSNPAMDKIVAAHDAVQAGADDIVIYYYRADGKYSEWGFWTWAFPGGDGGASWDRTQKLQVSNGVGYLKFKKDGSDIGISLMGANGTGIIPRRVDGWTKDPDGSPDRFINTVVTNEWVVFSGDAKSYPYGRYRPSIEAARLTKTDTLQIELSGKHAVTVDPSANGFVVGSPDGSTMYTVKDMYNTGSPNDRNKNFSKRLTLVLDRKVDLSRTITVSNPAYQLPVVVSTQALAVTVAEQTVPPADYALGPIYDAAKKSVEFRVWSPLSTGVTAQLYKANQGKTADAVIPLTLDAATGVWKGTFDKADPDGWFYDYDIASGSVHKTALDPYAPSMDVFTGAGPGRGAILNPAKTGPTGGWEGATDVHLAKPEDAIIYEVSVRDFTISADANVKNRPGSYLAFIEKLPYLKKLGITHIQLMPVLNFYYTDETKTAFEATGTASNNNYNWGYDPHSYFAPEGWFSSNPSDPYNRVVELKTLIKEAHKAGLGVLLDVVYNHTAKTEILNDLVPGYYYRMNADGSYSSNSGVGNDVASERVMARKLISDSINQWVAEYKVDGFRFDLMGLIEVNTLLQARERAAKNPDKADVLFEGEGWKMYNGPKTVTVMDQNYMKKTDLFSVFNDELRDLLKGGGLDDRAKGFLTDKFVNPKLVLDNLLGNPQLNYVAKDPSNNLQYTEAHDNLTMHDNMANNLGLKDSDPAQRAELAARIRLGNFLVLTSQGISFLHAGQESGRTKPKLNSTSEFLGDYIHNSYDAADNINQYVWKKLPEYEATTEYTAGLIAIRKAFGAFRLGDAQLIATSAKAIPASDGMTLGWSLKTKEGTFTMLVNSSKTEKGVFTAPASLSKAKVLVDKVSTSLEGLKKPQGLVIQGKKVTLEPLTAVLLRN